MERAARRAEWIFEERRGPDRRRRFHANERAVRLGAFLELAAALQVGPFVGNCARVDERRNEGRAEEPEGPKDGQAPLSLGPLGEWTPHRAVREEGSHGEKRRRQVNADARLAEGADPGDRNEEHHRRHQEGRYAERCEEPERLLGRDLAREEKVEREPEKKRKCPDREERDRNAPPVIAAKEGRVRAVHGRAAGVLFVGPADEARDQTAVHVVQVPVEMLGSRRRRGRGSSRRFRRWRTFDSRLASRASFQRFGSSRAAASMSE